MTSEPFDQQMQLEFTWRDARTLHSQLEAHSGLHIHLTITDNASSMLTVRHHDSGKAAKVRAHRMFLSADSRVVRALATWIRSPRAKKAGEAVNAFIREQSHQIRPGPRRRIILRTRGWVYDLAALFAEVNAAEFDNEVQAHVTWGRMPSQGRRRRSIRFGSYLQAENVIRIHPLLDQDFVPDFFVRYIMFHEMLHAHMGMREGKGGRRLFHTAEFRRRERAYADYDRAIAWHDDPKNMRRLLKDWGGSRQD
ncbi:MAG: hypothetical protein GWP08_05415 [Nitrospiraceae bacterium]|nr:hypothetical protein [Nitrospiraceae bacterium]